MIRKAVAEDTVKIAPLIINSWKTAYKGLISDDYLNNLQLEKIEKIWKRNIISQKEEDQIFIYEENDKILGAIRFGNPQDKETTKYNAEIHVLYVEPNMKRKGIGTKLFKYATDDFLNKGKRNLIIWCLKGNKQGMNFYKKMGGKIVSERMSTVNGIEVPEIGLKFDL